MVHWRVPHPYLILTHCRTPIITLPPLISTRSQTHHNEDTVGWGEGVKRDLYYFSSVFGGANIIWVDTRRVRDPNRNKWMLLIGFPTILTVFRPLYDCVIFYIAFPPSFLLHYVNDSPTSYDPLTGRGRVGITTSHVMYRKARPCQGQSRPQRMLGNTLCGLNPAMDGRPAHAGQ